MNETLFVPMGKLTKNFTMVDNAKLYDKRMSDSLFRAITLIFNHSRMNPGVPMTQKRFMEISGLSRHKTRKVFYEAEELGYVTHNIVLPHKQTDTENMYYVNHWIQHEYTWYEDPAQNTNYSVNKIKTKKEKKNMISSAKDFLKQYNENTQPMEITEEIVEKDEVNNNYYSYAMEKFKNTVFANIISDDFCRIDVSEDIDRFIKANLRGELLTRDTSIEELAEVCWNIIVRADSFSDKSYNDYRYTKYGIKKANNMIPLIVGRFNTQNIYDKNLSKLDGVRNEKDGLDINKTLLAKFTVVIANYIDLGYLLNDSGKKRIPTDIELMTLYSVLEAHPELMCLKSTEEQYSILDQFFKQKIKLK